MAVTDISELRRERERKRMNALILRTVLIVLLVAAAVAAVFTRSKWLPAFEALFEKPADTSDAADSTTGQISKGSFPIALDSSGEFQLLPMDGAIAVLDDSRLRIYNLDGKETNTSQHALANPILVTSKTKALIYDVGGTEFRLESRYKNIYDLFADDVIYLARLSSKDQAAVVTRSDRYLSQLIVYDDTGDEQFKYSSYDSRIIDVTFTNDCTGCLITVITAEQGTLRSGLIRYDFSSNDPVWESSSVPTLSMNVSIRSNGTIAMTGDTGFYEFDSNGVLISSYEYPDPIAAYSTGDDVSAVLMENSELRRTQLVMFAMGKEVHTESLDKAVLDIYSYGGEVYVLSENEVVVYSPDGQITGRVVLEDRYESLCRNGKYIFLAGYESINRVPYAR